MSKVTRQKLVKGTKLQAQPVDDLFVAVENELEAPSINKENIPYESSFHLNWIVDSIVWSSATTGKKARDKAFVMPFILAPTQDLFGLQIAEDSEYYTLREITFSHDQGDEAINWFPHQTKAGPVYEAMGCTKGDAGNYNFVLSIYKKTPSIVTSEVTHWETEVVSFIIPGTAFLLSNMGLNPYVIKDINKLFAPDSVYSATLKFEGQAPSPDFATPPLTNNRLVNIEIDLKFTTPLRTRDTGTGDIDPTGMANAPKSFQTVTSDSVIIGSISPSDPIQSDPIQLNLEALDEKLTRKLSGGFNDTYSKPQYKEQTSVAAYECFNVQLFNNIYNYEDEGYDLYQAPYTWTTVADPGILPDIEIATQNFEYLADRRILPINEPFEIHGIYLCWQQRQVTGPDSTLAEHQLAQQALAQDIGASMNVEVVLHSGWNSDWYGTQPIAYSTSVDWLNDNVVDQAVDPFIQGVTDTGGGASGLGDPTTRIIQVPLNFDSTGAQNSEGVGFIQTGIPVFVGRGVGYNSNQRTSVCSNTSATIPNIPYTRGVEKCLEFKVTFTGLPYTNLESNHYFENGPTAPGMTFIVVGKKSLVKSSK